MATHIQLYSVDSISARNRMRSSAAAGQESARSNSEAVKAKTRALLKNLAAGLKIFATGFFAYRRAWIERPGVMVDETERVSDLSSFNNYYGGLVRFRFHPYVTAMSRNRATSACARKARKNGCAKHANF
jgi:hypothetical protein